MCYLEGMLPRHGLAAPLVCLLVACNDGGAGGSSGTSAPTTVSPATGPSSDTGSSSGGTTGLTGGLTEVVTTGGTTTTGGVKLDVGQVPDFGGPDTGGMLPLTCENLDKQDATSVGCEFWGVDVPMLQSNELAYGISVGNPTDQTATVTIEDKRGPGDTLRMITQLTLMPKQSQLVQINGQGGILPGDNQVGGQGKTGRAAFRVSSDVPITAMQINPVGGGPSHVAEASLLLPTQALGQSYFAIDYPSDFGTWVIAVATEDGTTLTTSNGPAALDAFDAWTFVPGGGDSTGFFVGSDKPIALFSGTPCVLIPGQPWYACDHLEEQIVPAAAWGTRYVGGRHPQRVPAINPAPEEVRWRILAGVDGTTVTLTPAQPGVGGQVMLAKAGDVVEFASVESFLAEGDQPFMLAQFMTGCYNVIKSTGQPMVCDQGATGDPYMVQIPPIEQWLLQIPFLTDTSYPRDFIIITREAGTEVMLDCLGVVPDDHFSPIPGTPYEVGHVDLDIDGNGGEGSCVDGQQFISADQPIGLVVGGLDWATSYAYPGGLNFKALWDPPMMPPG